MRDDDHEPIHVNFIAAQIVCWAFQGALGLHPRLHVSAMHFTSDSDLMIGDCDVAVIDGDCVHDARQLESLIQSRSAESPPRIIYLAGEEVPEFLDRFVIEGLHGVVSKSDTPDTLVQAIDAVHHGDIWIDRRSAARVVRALSRRSQDPDLSRIGTLTTRERQVIAAMTTDTGVPAKVIAHQLQMSEHTLRNHLTSVYAKLSLNNRLDLLAFAMRHGRLHANAPVTGMRMADVRAVRTQGPQPTGAPAYRLP